MRQIHADRGWSDADFLCRATQRNSAGEEYMTKWLMFQYREQEIYGSCTGNPEHMLYRTFVANSALLTIIDQLKKSIVYIISRGGLTFSHETSLYIPSHHLAIRCEEFVCESIDHQG